MKTEAGYVRNDPLGPMSLEEARKSVAKADASMRGPLSRAGDFVDRLTGGTQRNANGAAQNQTLMQKLMPGQSTTGPKVNSGALTRDTTTAVRDLSKVSQTTQGQQAVVKDAKAQFSANFQNAQAQAQATFKEVAAEMGHDPKVALASVLPNQTSGLQAAGVLAVDLVTGGAGSALAGAGVVHEVISANNKLKPGEIEAIMKEASKRAAEHAQQRQQEESGTRGPDTPPPQEQQFAFENINPQEFADLVSGSPEQQPEFQALDDVEHHLELRADEQFVAREQQYDDRDGSKLEAAIERGDTEAIVATVEGREAEIVAEAPEVAEMVGIEPTIEANDVDMAEFSLQTYESTQLQVSAFRIAELDACIREGLVRDQPAPEAVLEQVEVRVTEQQMMMS